MKAPVPAASADPMPTGGVRAAAICAAAHTARPRAGSRQQQVWAKVRKVQEGLSSQSRHDGECRGVADAACSSRSKTRSCKDAQAAYLKALKAAGEKDGDVIGYVFAINGKLNSAEVYPSNGLFRKMWPKLLQASVTEAIGQKNAGARRDADEARPRTRFSTRQAGGVEREAAAGQRATGNARGREGALFRNASREWRLRASQLSGEVSRCSAGPRVGDAPPVGSVSLRSPARNSAVRPTSLC